MKRISSKPDPINRTIGTIKRVELKDSFFSYNAYNIFDENCNQEKERDINFNNFLSEVSQLTEYHSNLGIRNVEDWKQKILKGAYTEEEHNRVLSSNKHSRLN